MKDTKEQTKASAKAPVAASGTEGRVASGASQAIPVDIAAMSFEEALGELQTLVKSLERGDSRLDDAIRAYERGAALKRHCEAKLREAQAKIDMIVATEDGSITARPADFEQ